MLVLTLDTSCFEAGSKELDFVMELFQTGKIKVQISPITMGEIVKDHPAKMKQYVEHLRSRLEMEVEENKEFDRISNKVLRIYYSDKDQTDTRGIQRLSDADKFTKSILKHEGDYNDIDIFTHHVMSKADFFVTKDFNDFIRNGKNELFEKEFSTKIRYFNSGFMNELKLLIN